jgi:RNA polymerase sigma factor (TIGR02999 family)
VSLNVTDLLKAIDQGDPQAGDQLWPLVYDELRRLAAQKLARETPGQTLQATALVNEAYLRLVGKNEEAGPAWENRRHFFGAAAEAMRRILIERARYKTAIVNGGGLKRVPLDEELQAGPDATDRLLEIDEALTALEAHDDLAARLVKLRYFAGLQHQEAAAALGIGRGAADRLWALARAWLYQRLADGE